MSMTTVRELAQRWLPAMGLDNLARTLGIIHSAVEHPAPTVGSRVACTGSTLINSTTDADITGATITFTPEVDMSVMVWATVEISCAAFGAATHAFSAALVVNGTAATGRIESTVTAANDAISLSGSWIVPLLSGTAYTLKLQGKTANVATTFNVLQVNTWFTYLQVPNLFRVP